MTSNIMNAIFTGFFLGIGIYMSMMVCGALDQFIRNKLEQWKRK